MNERMRGTENDMEQSALLWAVERLEQKVKELTAERDALKKKLASTQLDLTISEQEAQALKDEMEYTFTRLGDPRIRTQLPAAKQEPFAEWSAKVAPLFEPYSDVDEVQP